MEDIDVKKEVKDGYTNTLRNKYYGLLCEFEKGREWEKFLDSIILELMGMPEDQRGINFYPIFFKTNTLRFIKYEYFRTTIFDIMHLISGTEEEWNGLLR